MSSHKPEKAKIEKMNSGTKRRKQALRSVSSQRLVAWEGLFPGKKRPGERAANFGGFRKRNDGISEGAERETR